MKPLSKHLLTQTGLYLMAGLGLLLLSYSLPRLLPGDFVTARYAGSDISLSQAQESELLARYDRNRGFLAYLGRMCRLDWGHSLAFAAPVAGLILEALPWTLLLMGSAHLLATSFGFVAGVEAAWRRGGVLEKLSLGFMTVLEGIPEIGTGVLLLLVFALKLGWFPSSGAQTPYAEQSGLVQLLDVCRHLVLPLITLILAYFPGNFLLARGSMVLVLKAPFVQTARGKGLPPRRVRYHHAARNALVPIITRFGLRLAFMITGALVVETIFAYPGLGTLLFKAIGMRDLPLIQGIVLASSLLVLAVNLGLEFVYVRLDPGVRHAR